MEWIMLLLAGGLSGLLAGLLGIGGGMVTVPAMIWLLPLLGIPAEGVMHVAVATALAVIIPTALLSAYSHHRRQAVDWPLVRGLGPALFLGALLAAPLAETLSRQSLQTLFALFAILVAASLLLGSPLLQARVKASRKEQSLAGAAIGLWAALVGTGGGTLTVPYLHWRGLSLHRAVGTSAACGFPIALAGAMGFAGLVTAPAAQAGLLGMIYLPAALVLMVASLLCAPMGVRLAHRLPVIALRRILAVALLLVAWQLLKAEF